MRFPSLCCPNFSLKLNLHFLCRWTLSRNNIPEQIQINFDSMYYQVAWPSPACNPKPIKSHPNQFPAEAKATPAFIICLSVWCLTRIRHIFKNSEEDLKIREVEYILGDSSKMHKKINDYYSTCRVFEFFH